MLMTSQCEANERLRPSGGLHEAQVHMGLMPKAEGLLGMPR